MSIYKRKLICSSKLFNGYTIEIDVRYYSNIQEIIDYFKNNLYNVLKKNNFEILIVELSKCNFHIHTHTFEEILLDTSKHIYICDC